MQGQSLFNILGLPATFTSALLIVGLILLLAPYTGGRDFGLFKIPDFGASANNKLRIIGPIVFVLLLVSFAPLFPPASNGNEPAVAGPCKIKPGTSIWTVGDSTVFLEAEGTKRTFKFEEPSAEMQKRGVKPCTVLFDGEAENPSSYSGTVFVYSGQCPVERYEVTGPVLDGPIVELVGEAPRINQSDCRVLEKQEEKLTVKYSRRL